MKERTISNKTILYRIIRSWRTLIVGVLVGLILLNGFMAFRTKRQIRQAEEELAALEEAEAEAEAEAEEENAGDTVKPDPEMSAREVTETQVAVEVYKSLRKDYLQTLQYLQNSLYMQINPNAVSRYRLQYLVDNHFEVTYPTIDKKDTTGDILQSYSLRLTNNDVCIRIADALGLEAETSYIRELISVYSSEDILNVSVIGKDYDSCMQIASILKQELSDSYPEFRNLYGAYDITLINEEYYISTDSDMFSKQLAQFTHLTSTKNTFNGLPQNMTDLQKQYYYALLDSLFEDNTDAEESIDISSDTGEEEAIVVPPMRWFSVKASLVGIILGLFLGAGWIILRMLLSPNLQSTEDMKNAGIPVLGEIVRVPEKKRLFGFIDQALFKKLYSRELKVSEEDRLDMIETGIRIAAKKEGGRNVFLTGTDMTDASQALMQRIVGDLKDSLDISSGRSILMDPVAMESLTASDGAVLVETLGESLFEEVGTQIERCRQNSIPVLGCIIMK